MESNEYNAMVFLSNYNPESVLLFNNINELQLRDDNVDFTAIVTIEQTKKIKKYLCLTIVKVDDGKKLAKGRLLKEFNLNDENVDSTDMECTKSKSVLKPSVAKYSFRNTYKLDFSKIALFGEGSYMLTLLECSAEELKRNAQEIHYTKQISTVCISVK